MPTVSAAVCLWRVTANGIEILIVHPGGPFWAKKDEGAWSLPKGEFDPHAEEGLDAARREFAEETGCETPASEPISLGATKLKSGKTILAWAIEGDLDADKIESNTFEIEWPPRSGRRASFPEVDRALWANPATARAKLNPAQAAFVDRLLAEVSDS